MNIEINWLVVLMRLLDGFMYGTGFVVAIIFWFAFIRWITG